MIILLILHILISFSSIVLGMVLATAGFRRIAQPRLRQAVIGTVAGSALSGIGLVLLGASFLHLCLSMSVFMAVTLLIERYYVYSLQNATSPR